LQLQTPASGVIERQQSQATVMIKALASAFAKAVIDLPTGEKAIAEASPIHPSYHYCG